MLGRVTNEVPLPDDIDDPDGLLLDEDELLDELLDEGTLLDDELLDDELLDDDMLVEGMLVEGMLVDGAEEELTTLENDGTPDEMKDAKLDIMLVRRS